MTHSCSSSISNVLTIAGTDPSGGSGVQADLKTFSALGVYGMSAITALVAQNTLGVNAIHAAPADFVAAQVDGVFSNVRVDAVKIGMVNTADVVDVIADRLQQHQVGNIVLDPVMVAKSGDRRLDPAAVATVRDKLVPLATVMTPNVPEASVLLDQSAPTNLEAMGDAAHALHLLGAKYSVLKGVHLKGKISPDLFYDGQEIVELMADRIETKKHVRDGLHVVYSNRCASSAVFDMLRKAKSYLTGAIRRSDQLDIGQGHGPVHKFHQIWPLKDIDNQTL
jgi:hydroxymethylpyrimidine/phosphomethylpyrimidine kinase